MCHCEVSDRCQRKSSKRYLCGRGRAPPLRTARKFTAPHAKSLSLRSRCVHRLWQSVLPCGDNLFGAPHSLYRTGRTESSAPTSHSVGATLAVARPTAFLETNRRGRRPRRPVCTVLHALTPPHTSPPRKRTDAPQASVLLKLSKNPLGFSDKRLAVCCAHNFEPLAQNSTLAA